MSQVGALNKVEGEYLGTSLEDSKVISRKMTAAFTDHSPASIRKSSTHSADTGPSFPLRQQLCGNPSSRHLNQGSCVYGCHGDVSASPKKALSPGRGSLGAQEWLGRQDGLVGWYQIGRSHPDESREPVVLLRCGQASCVWCSRGSRCGFKQLRKKCWGILFFSFYLCFKISVRP